MRRIAWGTMGLLLALGAMPGEGPGAAAPSRYRPLTEGETAWVEGASRRSAAAGNAGRFEEAARLAREVYDLHRRVQGPFHDDTIDARTTAEEWRWLSKVPAGDRPRVVRA